MNLLLINEFDVFITVDKNLSYQQNFDKYPISVLVIDTKDNSYDSIMLFIDKIKELLKSSLPKGLTIIS